MKGLKGGSQVILYVTDMARSVAFWRDEVGLTLTHPLDSSDMGSEAWVTFDAVGFELALHSGGDPDRHLGPAFSFFVEDLEEAVKDLESRGVWHDGIRSPRPGVSFCPVHDPDGNLFFLKPASKS